MHSQKHRTRGPASIQAIMPEYQVSGSGLYSEPPDKIDVNKYHRIPKYVLVFPMDFPRTYERMAIWSAMPTSLLGAGFGAGSGSSFLGPRFLGAGSMSALRNSSQLNLTLDQH